MSTTMNQTVLDMLRESMLRRYVQFGTVVEVKPVTLPGDKKEEIIEILFQGVSVFCKKQDFSKRQLRTFRGFLGTEIPFVVKDITAEGYVIVSRVEAMPLVQNRFVKHAKEGDIVRGSVTGMIPENNIVFVEVQGFPCMVGPGEWDMNPITDLREVVAIGMDVEVKITSIKKIGEDGEDLDKEWEFDYKIRVSRRAVLREAVNKVWDEIENYHREGDNVLAKIVAQAPGPNSWLVKLAKSGIVIIGNLQRPLNEKYKHLPQGLQVHVVIRNLDKQKREGKSRIFRIDPTLKSTMENGF